MDALEPGQLLSFSAPKKRLSRIVDVIEGETVYLYEIKKCKRTVVAVQPRKYAEIISALQAGTAEIQSDDPYLALVIPIEESDRSPKAERRREIEAKKDQQLEERFAIVSYMISRGGVGLYEKEARNMILAEAVEEFGVDRVTLKRYLGLFYRGGVVPAALRPDYKTSGRPKDHPTNLKSGINKDAGVKVDATLRQHLIDFFAIHDDPNLPLIERHKKFVTMHGADGYDLPDENGNARLRLRPLKEIINPASFSKWHYKLTTEIERLKAKLDPRKFARDHRDIKDSAITKIHGPGSRYEADFTVASNVLVSRYRRSQVLGSPVVGIVWDVYSGAAVGLLITWQHASALQLRQLIYNTLCDKVAYCARFGVLIKREQWPMQHAPKLWVFDRGEAYKTVGDSLTKNFGWFYKNLAPMRPDLKGVVESGFAKLKRKTKLSPGWKPSLLKRGDKDYDAKGCATIDEYTADVIKILIEHNNTVCPTRAQSLPTLQMTEPTTPVNIWNDGIVERSGYVRKEPENRVRALVLPDAKANMSLAGIEFEGIRYVNEELANQKVRARKIGRKDPVVIHYNPDLIDEIYYPVDAKKSKFLVCTATGTAAQCKGLSFIEYDLVQKDIRQMNAKDKHKVLEDAVNVRLGIEQQRKESKAATAAARKADGLSLKKYLGSNRRPKRAKEITKTRIDQSKGTVPYSEPDPKNVIAGDFKAPATDTNAPEEILDAESLELLRNFKSA